MRKALSELVVIVMLLMVSIVLVGLAFIFISGFQEQAKGEVQQQGAESFKRIGSCLQTVSFDGKTNSLYVKNCGRYPIENVSVFIDGKPSGAVSLNAKPNEIKSIAISASVGIHEIKLTGDYTSAAISVNVTNAAPVCSDGTQYGQCSPTKPLYCNSGTLVNKCSMCGCSSGVCQADESCAGGFDFSMSAVPSSGSVAQGLSASSTATTTLASGATQPVALSCSGLPAGASCSFSPSSVNPTASSSLTISTAATTPTGTYAVTISGTGGGLTRTTSYSLTVNAPTTFNFSMSASPSSGSVVQGNNATTTATATLVSGTSQSVSLSCSAGLPTGASCSFSPSSINPTASSALTISTLGTTPTGTYPITISGAGGSVPITAPYSLSVVLTPKKVFVTSGTYSGNLGGLSGADAICQALANAVPSLAGKTFKAWLSDSATSAASRLTHSASSYVRMDNAIVANNWNDIVSGSLRNPIQINENSADVGVANVWTGTSDSGTNTGQDCSSWTYSNDADAYGGTKGWSSEVGSAWTNMGYVFCKTYRYYRLYCFEQ